MQFCPQFEGASFEHPRSRRQRHRRAAAPGRRRVASRDVAQCDDLGFDRAESNDAGPRTIPRNLGVLHRAVDDAQRIHQRGQGQPSQGVVGHAARPLRGAGPAQIGCHLDRHLAHNDRTGKDGLLPGERIEVEAPDLDVARARFVPRGLLGPRFAQLRFGQGGREVQPSDAQCRVPSRGGDGRDREAVHARLRCHLVTLRRGPQVRCPQTSPKAGRARLYLGPLGFDLPARKTMDPDATRARRLHGDRSSLGPEEIGAYLEVPSEQPPGEPQPVDGHLAGLDPRQEPGRPSGEFPALQRRGVRKHGEVPCQQLSPGEPDAQRSEAGGVEALGPAFQSPNQPPFNEASQLVRPQHGPGEQRSQDRDAGPCRRARPRSRYQRHSPSVCPGRTTHGHV